MLLFIFTDSDVSKNSLDTVKLNGEEESLADDVIEESKYTTASSATAAEYEVSDVSVLLNLKLEHAVMQRQKKHPKSFLFQLTL